MAKKRKKGEGLIRKRADGRWEGRYVVGYDEDGLPKTKAVLAKTKTECAEKLRALKSELKPEVEKAVPSMLTGEWLDFWYRTYSKPAIRVTTQLGYEQYIYNYATPAIGGIELAKLSAADMQKFVNELKRNGRIKDVEKRGASLSNKTVRDCFAVVRKALDKAVEDGLISANPCVGCKLPSGKSNEMKVLDRDEIYRFLMQAKQEGMYELFLLDLLTGLRRGEILALRWSDLDFATGELRVARQLIPVKGQLVFSEPKTKAGRRTIILPPAMLELLAEYKRGVHSELIFPSRIIPDKPLDPTYVRKRLQVILERAGCKHVRFHDLRHTFATMSLEHGMDIKTLATIIGHVSASTTLNTYAHTTTEMQRNAARKIDSAIVGAEPNECETALQPPPDPFEPYKTPRRRPGTGYVKQIRPNTWEGRYSPIWPDGKKRSRNVYASTEAECEAKLRELIIEMKAEIAEERERAKQRKIGRGRSRKSVRQMKLRSTLRSSVRRTKAP